MYINSNETKAVYVGIPLSVANRAAFRYFPGADLSSVGKTLYACDDEGDPGCYDPEARLWYEAAIETGRSADTSLGEVVVVEPYIGALGSPEILEGSQQNWLVTLARAVYSDDGSTIGPSLGVVGVDIRLEQIQESVEGINFLDSGFSILATAEKGKVLAAPSRVWDRESAGESTTVCDLGIGICTSSGDDDDGDGWAELLSATELGVYEFVSTSSSLSSSSGEGEASILIAAPVTAIFDTDSGEGVVTHYILSAVPRAEIFKTVGDMVSLIKSSRNDILATTGFVAVATLLAVAAAVWLLAGKITGPIVKMTAAAKSIAKDGAETNVFGGVAAAWREGGAGGGSSIDVAGSRNARRRTRAVDYLLCRGEDEISALVHEFTLMFTGLGKRGSAAVGTGLEESSVYPKNPFTTSFQQRPPSAPPAS